MKVRSFVLVTAAALLSAALDLFAQEQIAAPVFKEGDTWSYNIIRKGCTVSSTEFNEGAYDVTFTPQSIKLYQVSENQRSEITITSGARIQELLSLIGRSTQQPDLRFPLSIGQKWSYGYESAAAGTRVAIPRSVEIIVSGLEQVTTPAGSFKTYKLIRSESWSFRGVPGGTVWSYFYSPETRSIVRRLTENNTTPCKNETELTKFTPGS
jgi:hypothetical protein